MTPELKKSIADDLKKASDELKRKQGEGETESEKSCW
jgi:hypothetical protein